jgi:hypothetical protein
VHAQQSPVIPKERHRVLSSTPKTIRSGSSFTLTDIHPGEYDIRFVDEDGDSCTLAKRNIFQDLSWRLTDSWLLNCEAH